MNILKRAWKQTHHIALLCHKCIISIFTNSYTNLRTGTSDLKGQEKFSVREHSFADIVKICLVKTII